MHAMILAAGRGERMRPLTDAMPKPMLLLQGKPLIQHHVEHLVSEGIRDIVINHGRFGDQIEAHLGDGTVFNARIHYSPEQEELLETGGGIRKALPLLGADPFIAINADIWTDCRLQDMTLADGHLAHLVMVDNPLHHPEGDFALRQGRLRAEDSPKLTFSGIGLYHPALFKTLPLTAFPLAPLLRAAMLQDKVSGQHFTGRWIDIGTPERLEYAQTLIKE